MSSIFKRQVIYEGVDCVADMDTTLYAQLHKLASADLPWMSNLLYANYLLYFAAGIIFLFLLKFGWYNLIDGGYDSDLTTFQFLLFKKSQEAEGTDDNNSSSTNTGASKFDFSKTTNYRPSSIPKFTSLLRGFTYKRFPDFVSKFGLPRLNYGTYLVLFLFTVFIAALSFGPKKYYKPCFGFGSPPLALRTGLMAMSCMYFIYILSGKANLISWCTGIGYEKLYIYHKYISWSCLVLSFLHTFPFVVQPVREGGYAYWREIYVGRWAVYTSGFVALASIFYLCVGSLPFVKNLSHEMFVQFHWMVACVFFGTMVWHVANSMNTWQYMWAMLVIWIVQLLYRAGVKSFLKPNKWFLKPRIANISLLDDKAFELEIVNAGLDWEIGQHIFIRFVGQKLLQNHPFTISSIPTSSDSGRNHVKLMVRSKNGLTKEIQQALLESTKNVEYDPESNNKSSVIKKVFIDGPYGTLSRDINKFDNAILISNGSGVTFTLPFLMKFCKDISQSEAIYSSLAKNGLLSRMNQSMIKKINFVWIVRNVETIDWIQRELEECAILGKGLVSIDIYVTNGSVNEDINKQYLNKYSLFNIIYGKPNMRSVLNSLDVDDLLRRNIILCSGSGGLTCDVSNGAADVQSKVRTSSSHIEEIYLHTENFGY